MIRDGASLSFFAWVFTGVLVIPSYFSYAESPKWLYNKGKLDGLIKSLVFISKKNGTNHSKKDFFGLLVENDEEYEMVKDQKIRIDIKKKKKGSDKGVLIHLITNKK